MGSFLQKIAEIRTYMKQQQSGTAQVFLYGELASCKANKKYKARKCTKKDCPQKDCDFLHPGEEAQGAVTFATVHALTIFDRM